LLKAQMVRFSNTAMIGTLLVVPTMAGEDMGMYLTLPAEKCAVRFVAGGALCGEAAMSCALVSPVKAIFKEFEDGYCADAGESLKQIDTHTFAGVTVSAFVGNFGRNVTGDVVLRASSNPDWWPNWLPNLPSICVPGITPQVTIYNEAADYGIPCGEVKLDCQLVELAKLLRPFEEGTCAKAGYKVQAHQWPFEFPFFDILGKSIGEKIAFTIFEKTTPTQRKCTVNLPAGALCGEVTTACDLTPALKSFVNFTDGECPADLYQLVPGSAGDLFEGVTVSGFIDKTIPLPEISGKTCSVYDLGEEWAVKHGVPCAQVAMDCALVEAAKLMRDTVKDGECADAGFAYEKKSLWARKLWIPLAGDVVIKVFDNHRSQQILV